MKKFYRGAVVLLTLLVCFVFVPAALAHPLGNFTINQYAGLRISRTEIVLDYVVDMAEIPTVQEISTFDANANGFADPAETAGYPVRQCTSLQSSLSLALNKKALDLTLASASVDFPTGVGGLQTLRLTCEFQAPLDGSTETYGLAFHNDAFADRLGWQEIVVMPDGVSVQGEFTSTSPSKRLTDYPQDLLSSPLEQRGLELEITASGMLAPSLPLASADPGNRSASNRDDAFTRLILLEELSLPTLLLALGISFLWGAAHALTPGHGKTIVGAYLVGSRGTMKHAAYLGLTTTITHTLGVFALGLITLFAAQYILPETLYPWMSLFSGLFVVGIGVNLLTSRFKSYALALPKIKPSFSPAFQHIQAEGSEHSHKYVLNASRHQHSTHSHEHAHPHQHAHEHGHTHDHIHDAEGGHSHMPPEEITWRSLLALGVSGGLVPCPSALVVLLGAIALNKIGFGLVLVFAFSFGLAAALTAIGMMFIYAGRWFQRFPSQGRLLRLVPVLSALFVSVIGAAIIWKALGEMGII